MTIKRKQLFGAIVLIVMSVFILSMISGTSVHATNSPIGKDASPFSIGTSSISLNKTSVTIKSGGSVTVSYNVKLSSGKSWGTKIGSNSLSGISVSFSKGYADPPYSGTATISVASSVNNGTYTLSFSATGDDPSSSSTSLHVNVIDHTSSKVTPPPSKVTPGKSFTSLYGSDIAGASVIILFILAALVPMVVRRTGMILAGYASFVISMGSAIFLVVEDSLLRSSGYLHWILLLVFLAGMIIAMLGYIFTKGKLKDTARKGLAYGSIFMSIAMILDAALGLPLSSISNIGSSLGFKYLFGFGISAPSTVAVSLAFSFLLIFNGLIFSTFMSSNTKSKVNSSS